MNATAWATFWVFLGFLVFIGIVLYLKVPAKLSRRSTRAPPRSAPISTRRAGCALEAQALLAEYRAAAQRGEAEAEAIVAQARREAETFSEEARARIADYVTRRTKAVETRIAQAETQAVAEVRSRAIDVAAAAAGRILAEEAKGAKARLLVERAIETVRKSLN